MPNSLFKKGLVVGIIVLFIGVGIQPAISNEVSIPTISDSGKDSIEYKINEKMYLAEKLLNNIVSRLNIKSDDDCDCSDGDDYPEILCAILGMQLLILSYIYESTAGIGYILLKITYDLIVKFNCPF
ncbi:hypothetical protein AYK24_03690 [Thermoplasmatales archaeon SG8-52-4]|nr:MAG: hypothetical protein AYK24_03690 [Thermoplasmatales archaeon SG8-52-4]